MHISLYPRISEHEGISSGTFSTRAKKSNVEEPTESAEKSKNLVDEFEAYLRYTSSITQFPLQAQSRSQSPRCFVNLNGQLSLTKRIAASGNEIASSGKLGPTKHVIILAEEFKSCCRLR